MQNITYDVRIYKTVVYKSTAPRGCGQPRRGATYAYARSPGSRIRCRPEALILRSRVR